METITTLAAIMAGMIFSLAIALFVEELIFGQVFRIFFSHQAVAVKTGQRDTR